MPGLLVGLAYGALEGRLAGGGLQLATDRAPHPQIRRLGAEEQEVFAGGVFQENKDGDLIGEGGSRHQKCNRGGNQVLSVTSQEVSTTFFLS